MPVHAKDEERKKIDRAHTTSVDKPIKRNPPPTDPPPPTNPAPTDPPPTNPPPAGGPLDFACVVGMAPNGIDALLTFSGSNRGTSENLRRFDVYVDTITGLTTYQTP